LIARHALSTRANPPAAFSAQTIDSSSAVRVMDIKPGDAHTVLGTSAFGSNRAIAKFCGSMEKEWVMRWDLVIKRAGRGAMVMQQYQGEKN